jgi:hypothetical protein
MDPEHYQKSIDFSSGTGIYKYQNMTPPRVLNPCFFDSIILPWLQEEHYRTSTIKSLLHWPL